MRVPRPLARAAKRFITGAASMVIACTFSSSTSALRLFSAFAIADSSTLRTSSAPFLGVNFSVLSALPTGSPRTMSAISRHFCGEIRAYFNLAATCMSGSRLLVARVRLERARRSELTQLVTDHVLGNKHRHVLTAVMHRNRQTHHVRKNHRSARPGLDRATIVLLGGNTHLLCKVQVDERTFLDRTRHCVILN